MRVLTKRALLSVLWSIAATLLVGGYVLAQGTTDLPVGQPLVDRLTSATDVRYYRITTPGGGALPAGQHLVITLDKAGPWYGQVSVRPGALPVIGSPDTISSGYEFADGAVEIGSTQEGDYFVMVDSDGRGSGDFSIRADISPTLGLGVPHSDSVRDEYDRRWFWVHASAGQHLIITVDKPNGWWGQVWMKAGGLPTEEDPQTLFSGCAYSDEALDVVVPETADYFIRVDGCGWEEGPFTVTALTAEMMPTLTLDAPQSGQLTDRDDVKWYRVPVPAGEQLLVTLDKSGPWYSQLSTRPGALPLPGDTETISSGAGYEDQAVAAVAGSSTDYFVRVDGAEWGSGHYTITAGIAPTLDVGLPRIGRVTDAYDQKWYRVRSAPGQHTIVVVDKAVGWQGEVSAKVGGLPSPGDPGTIASGLAYSDQAVDVIADQAGDCFVQIAGDGGSYTITAFTPDLMQALPFGAPQEGELRDRDDVRWYRMQAPDAPPGQQILVFLNKDARWYSGMCGKAGRLPDCGDAVCSQYSTDAEQGLAIPAGPAGDYFVRVDGGEFGSGKFSIHAELGWALPPTVYSITPTVGGNTGVVTVRIRGKWLDPAATVVLRRDGYQDVAPIESKWINSAEIVSLFDLRGKPAGDWALVLCNPGPTCASAQPFDIVDGGAPQYSISIVGPDAVRVGREAAYLVSVTNTGVVDGLCPVLWISIPSGSSWHVRAELLPPPPVSGTDEGDWSEIPIAADDGIVTLIGLVLPALPSGETLTIPLDVTPPSDSTAFTINAYVSPPPEDPLESLPIQPASLASGRLAMSSSDIDCYSTILDKAASLMLKEGLIRLLPGADCAVEAIMYFKTSATSSWKMFWLYYGGERRLRPYAIPWTQMYLQGLLTSLTCAGEFIPWVKYPIAIVKIGKAAFDVWQMYDACRTQLGLTGKNTAVVRAIDPNEKSGTIGFGATGMSGTWTGNCPPDSAADNGYVSITAPIEYMVRFENLPAATAEAENIIITDTLDENVDWNTLEIGEARVGGQSYLPTVTLNPETRTIAWSFPGVNLPPNCDDPSRPECTGIGKGEGWVSFSVRPLSDLPTGAEIHNYASIVFDFNPPMCTNDVINWIDSGIPSSAVAALPTEVPYQFQVSWTGQDDQNGTGVRDYTVYVSDDGGPYTAWLNNTSDTSATFVGVWGHTYGFYSVARDNVGNMEPAPSPLQPDATTAVAGVHHFHFVQTTTPLGADLNQPLPASVTVEAHDPDHNTVTTYNGSASLTTSVGTIEPTAIQFVSGVANTDVHVLACVESGSIVEATLTAADDGGITGSSDPLPLRGKGDPSGDGVTNVLDVLRTVNAALGRTLPEPPAGDFQMWACDMPDANCAADGTVNVLDVLRVVNGALGRPSLCPCSAGAGAALAATAFATPSKVAPASSPIVSVAPGKRGTWEIRLTGATDIAGIQLEVTGADSMSAGELLSGTGWQLESSRPNGRLRVVAFSSTATGLTAREGVAFHLSGGRGRPRIANVLLSDAAGNQIECVVR